jgi:anti-sigma regulatory factor (Ser/Thr protein kinase)
VGSLLERWLVGLDAIPVVDEASVSLVREEVRRQGALAGLSGEAIESLAAAASELAHNQLAHAVRGHLALRAVDRGGVTGLEVIAADAGPGIADPTSALRGQPRPGGSLGVGMSAAQRLSEEMDIDVRLGEGTCVRVRRFAAPVTRSELAIFARPCEGETVCGDDAIALRGGSSLLLAVADGLGHGPLARIASSAAMGVVAGAPELGPAAILTACGPALQGTRGAVAAIARLGDTDLRIAGAGNVTAAVYRPRSAQRSMGNAYILGSSQRPPRFDEELFALDHQRTVILFTDGISARADLSEEPDTLRRPPIEVAQRLIERFGRRDDDVLVLVAR